MKQIISLSLTLIFVASVLSGCAFQLGQIDSLMRPPMAQGDYRKLQKVFYSTVGKDIVLKSPQGGDFRSSFILFDIDNDTENEAIAFYINRNDKSTVRVNVLNKINDQWESVADLSGAGAEVDSVRFVYMNDDKVPEILISWKINEVKLNSVLSIYSCQEKDGALKVSILLSEFYTLTESLDIDSNGTNEIFTVYLDRLAVVPQAYARVYKMLDNGEVVLLSQTKLDGNIVSYSGIKIEESETGKPLRIFIDAYKGETQMITEMIYWDSDKNALASPLLNPQTQSNILTLRNSRIPSSDINGDGVIDIPIQETLNGSKTLQAENDKTDIIYLTKWISVTNDGNAVEVLRAVINISGGYLVTIPKDFYETMTVINYNSDKKWDICEFVGEDETVGDVLFSILSVNRRNWDADSSEYEGYFPILNGKENVIVAKISSSGLKNGLNTEYIFKNIIAYNAE